MGLDSPLSVTQMLWVNLIMDTFAALALSSLPADAKVMNEPPRNPKMHIIDKKMTKRILVVGLLFFIYLFGLWQLLWHGSISMVSDLISQESLIYYFTGFGQMAHAKAHLSQYELSVFFTTFVALQFWNLFNVKYFRTDRSLMLDILDIFRCPQKVKQTYSFGFIFTLGAILFGQIIIVNFCGSLFNVAPLSVMDWVWIMIGTSIVLIIPEIVRTTQIIINKGQ